MVKVIDDWPAFDLGMMPMEEWVIWRSVKSRYLLHVSIQEALE